MKLLKSTDISRLILSLIIIVLLLAAVNVPFALTKFRSRSSPYPPNQEQYQYAEAAAFGWPSTTPHTKQWPPPLQVTTWKAFGIREFNVFWDAQDDSDTNGYSMEVQQLGWPLPAIEQKQMWWDWNDPALSGPESDPRPQLVPLGVALNPLIVGVPIWLLLFALPLMIKLYIRKRRQRRGKCVWCGYTIDSLNLCPECGIANDSID